MTSVPTTGFNRTLPDLLIVLNGVSGDAFIIDQLILTTQAQKYLGVSYNRADRLVSELIGLDVLRERGKKAYKRRFYAPEVLDVFVSRSEH